MQLYQLTYQLPNQPTLTTRGLTREGVRDLQNIILLKGGWGSCSPLK